MIGLVAATLYVLPELQLTSPKVATASSLIPYACIAWLVSAALFATHRHRWSKSISVLAVAGLVSQLLWASPYWPGNHREQGTLSILTLNLRCKTIGLQELNKTVAQHHPQIVALQGVNTESRRYLEQLGWYVSYPGSTFHPKKETPTCGSMVFSTSQIIPLTGPSELQPVVRVSTQPRPLLIFPVDIPTPRNNLSEWLNAFQALSDSLADHETSDRIALGDFNAVREHEPMRRLMNITGVRDAREDAGAGWLPTFPATGHLPSIVALDHVLVSPDIVPTSVIGVQIGENTHLALLAMLDIPLETSKQGGSYNLFQLMPGVRFESILAIPTPRGRTQTTNAI